MKRPLFAVLLCVAAACGRNSRADDVDYEHVLPFDTTTVRIASVKETTRITVLLADSQEQQPCTTDLAVGCPTYPPGAAYRAALEVNAGFFARTGGRVGDRVLLGDTVSRRRGARGR